MADARRAGVAESRRTGVTESRRTGVTESRRTGVTESRRTGVGHLRRADPRQPDRLGPRHPGPAGGVPRAAAASVAVGSILAGAVTVTVAVVTGPGSALTGYVSEAGVADSPSAPAYRSGIFALAAALILVAAALPTGLRVAAALLAAGGALTLLSGAVTCSAGCPLPPFERTTVADLVHGGASVAATAAVVFAMVAITLSPRAGRPLRRLAGTAAGVALPLAGAMGLAMLTVGRGSLVGALERLLLLAVLLWGAATAAAIALRRT
ncbi:DUF998 domain-containing protein [Micromonospora sp. WMMA1363]|uniref:DUF998 domain-containing protein n=1 Tax=Micromonospora sp. WMMA1363 TaxID=3053985 RepID=UPI00259C91FA|nr:DUF998 domain-containing protein [Micromonospora sp. WMMA1363]MDM4723086.1 DUF998 domain-containing protein [Micromonospora sp. WMMA1363]